MPEPITWHDVMRRHAAGEPLHDLMDEMHAADNEHFRSFLADEGPKGVEALRRYDARVRDVETGVTGARNCWHALSPAQRRTLLFLAPGRVLVRSARLGGYYDAAATAPGVDTVAKAARLDTVRNVAARGLVAWDGGAFDPEARAVMSERAAFVLAHGRVETNDAR